MNRQVICLIADEQIHALRLETHRRGITVGRRSAVECSVPTALGTDADGHALVEAMVSAIATIRQPNDDVMLVLPLHWCFVHPIGGGKRRPSQEALAYEFEPFLPLPLEAVACTFVPTGSESFLGVAVPLDPVRRLIDALSERDVDLAGLSVDVVALIAASAGKKTNEPGFLIMDDRWIKGGATGAHPTTAVVHRHKKDLEVSKTELVRRLWSDPAEPLDGCKILDLQSSTFADTAGGPPTDSDPESRDVAVSGDQAVEIVARAAALSDLDLRTGALAGGRASNACRHLAMQCSILLLAALSILVLGLHVQGRALHRNLGVVRAEQQRIYQSVFNVATLPAGGSARLASEKLRLQGLTRADSTDRPQTGTEQEHGLDVLRNAVAALPADVRIMLSDLRIESGQLFFRGRTGEHRDAERIAESLAGVTSISSRPPRTRRLTDGGVEFSISASLE